MTWRSTQTGAFTALLFLTACATSQGPADLTKMNFQADPTLSLDSRGVASDAGARGSLPTNRMSPSKAYLGGVDWKLVFNQALLRNINKTVEPNKVETIRAHSLYYSKNDFNTNFASILNNKSSEGAYRGREDVLGYNPKNLADVSRPIGYPPNSPQIERFKKAAQEGSYVGTQNYFDTEMGREIMEDFHDTVFVVVPGFGSHTIKDYTWDELVSAANVHYGRAPHRPDAKAAPFLTFYGSPNQEVKFDVVHPMGDELGFSMGRDQASADKLATWLMKLKTIPAYAEKKWILLGYSKGAPIAQNMVANHPEIRKDVLAIVTMAGVNQGATPAESAMNTVRTVMHQDDLDKYFQSLKGNAEEVQNLAQSVMGGMLGLNANVGKTVGPFVSTLINAITSESNQLTADQAYRVLFGVEDMSVFNRTQWNLENLNDAHFKSQISIFNISALANIADFMLPEGFKDGSEIPTPLVIPQIESMAQINNRGFSRDDVFLYTTSLTGFRESAGGLFDTQVAWLDTKSMALDDRPLNASLSQANLDRLRSSVEAKGVKLPDDFATIKRSQLLTELQNGGSRTMNFIDLGEVRGTHWDLAFEQVYKPKVPSKDDYQHRFPRRALQASVLETLALYRLMGGM